jgi:hypothetical protein
MYVTVVWYVCDSCVVCMSQLCGMDVTVVWCDMYVDCSGIGGIGPSSSPLFSSTHKITKHSRVRVE